MEMEFDKYCKVGRSPRTVLLPPHRQTKGESRSKKGKPSSRNGDYGLLSLEDEGFTDVKFRNYRSVSCKNLPSGDVEFDCNEVLRRGSVYQSSREREFKRPGTIDGRKKIEFSVGSETSFSFSILDSICGSDEEAEAEPLEHEKVSVNPLNSDMVSSPTFPKKLCATNLKERQDNSGKCAERDLMKNQKFKCDQVSGPSNDANVLKERDTSILNKSLSAKLALPHSPSHSEGESSKGSQKSRFTPIRKMFDPLTKSKSHRSSLNDSKSSGLPSTVRNKILRKSLLHDFSSAVPIVESAPSQSVKKDPQPVVPPCSPAHLNGNLRMEHKHGLPYFEFSTAHSEDVLTANTWKAENALNWVYTFHSLRGRKKSNATGWGMRYSNKDFPMVGQMQISCHLCSDFRSHGTSSSSMVTEFVLYDIAHARKSITTEEEVSYAEISKISSESIVGSVKENVELDDLFSLSKPRLQTAGIVDRSSVDVSAPCPWAPAELHPSQEIAAIVVQVPFEKRESLKGQRDKFSNQDHANYPDLSSTGRGTKDIHNEKITVKVNVVTPLGNHGLPSSDESRGPSPLLDKWRVGGGCDCGGWDMACPLIVFGNLDTQCMEDHSPLQQDHPLELYVQGGKENLPALTIAIKEKGHYTVDFHAQLSALQAFATCVAILHTTEASSLAEHEKNKQLLQCSSLKVFVEDEMKVVIEAVTEEERRKVVKKADASPASFVLNPPFSPIARV